MSDKLHLVTSLVTLASLIFIARLVRSGQLRPKYSLLWFSIGLVMAALAIFPPLLDKVSLMLGVAYGPATLFMATIMLLLLLAIHFSWELSRLEERTRSLAEELAIISAARETHRASPPEQQPS